MHPVCSGCAAPCCVGRVVPVGDDEVARLAAALGVPADAFAERSGDGLSLRQRDGGACVFAVAVDESIRCGIEPDKPRSCRVYPYHVAARDDGGWDAALGHDAACPPPRHEAWAARVDDERHTIDSAVAEGNGDVPARRRTLPVVAATPCFGCTTSCCLDYEVPVSAHDVWRLTRALAVPWPALVRVRPTPATWMESFTLDASGKKQALHLLRAAGGACSLLVTLPDGARRCGVHALRPLACRLYPYRGDWTPGAPVRLQNDAICPTAQRAAWDDERHAAVDDVAAQVGERRVYMRALARWNQAARTRPPSQPYAVDDFLRWSFGLYDAIERVRAGGGDGLAAGAAEVIATFPLPDESAPGC